MFHTYVTIVLSRCYICLQWFSIVFASVSDACFECFICLLLYVASGYFKSRSGVTYGMRVGSGRGTSGPRAGDVRATRAHAWTRDTKGKPTVAADVRGTSRGQ
jgi:hypothetical protein